MELIVVSDRRRGAEVVAHTIVELIGSTSQPRLGLATGGSLEPVYEALEAEVVRARVSLGSLRCFMLDEYVGLPLDHPARYRNVIEEQVVRRLGLDSSQVHAPDVTAADLGSACAAYEDELHGSGGIDLQLLGIGANGHIGFNEPGSSRSSRTRVATLTEQTRVDNARFFGGGDPGHDLGAGDRDDRGDAVALVPRKVVTEGIATILDARRIVLVAWGERKASAVRSFIEGPVSEAVPASLLRTHPSVTVVVDRAAAAELSERGAVEHAAKR